MRAPRTAISSAILSLTCQIGADQAGTSLELADIALVKEFRDRPHRPVVRALNNGVENIIGMLVAGQRRTGIEVQGNPIPPLRDDAD
jgi:hypothetical protein